LGMTNRMEQLRKVVLVCVAMMMGWMAGCGSGKAPDPLPEAEGAPPDQNIG